MERALAFWTALGVRRQTILVAATVGVFVSVLGIARLAGTPSMALLYSGLDPSAAGEVITALDAQGAIYEARGNAIYVDAARRDSLRMSLASDGLPANGARGYELLDSLTGFGTTSQMFDAAYWRAKEGEIARTIVSAAHIASARVHIGNPGSRPFDRAATFAASVTVRTSSGGLSGQQAKALRYLVASAVSGLDPDNVSVIDSNAGLVTTGMETAITGDGSASDRADNLRRNAQRLLEARVGYGNAVVEVTLETVTESEFISERRFDPDTRFAISTDTEERTDNANDERPGAVTVASNLADGDAGTGDRSSSSNTTETRERVNYEVSETQREVSREAGDIRRLSVAVLVDGIRTIDETGLEVWEPRSTAELEDLRELVSASVGLNAERGDTLTIRSLEFQQVSASGTESSARLLQSLQIDVMSLIQLAVLTAVALVLGLGVVRPLLLTGRNTNALSLPPPDLAKVSSDAGQAPALDGEIDFANDLPMGPMGADLRTGAKLPALVQPVDESVSRLRELIEDRQEEAVDILRGWMEDRGATS